MLCDVSTSVTSASVFFLSVLHALHDSFRKLRSFVFIERISEVTEVFERERDFRTIAEKISREGGVADVSGYTDYGRVWLELGELFGATWAALHDHRPRRRANQRARAARRRLRPNHGASRADLLAQPGTPPLLELRRLGDGGVRDPLHRRLRMLDDPAPRGFRERGGRRHGAGAGVLGVLDVLLRRFSRQRAGGIGTRTSRRRAGHDPRSDRHIAAVDVVGDQDHRGHHGEREEEETGDRQAVGDEEQALLLVRAEVDPVVRAGAIGGRTKSWSG